MASEFRVLACPNDPQPGLPIYATGRVGHDHSLADRDGRCWCITCEDFVVPVELGGGDE